MHIFDIIFLFDTLANYKTRYYEALRKGFVVQNWLIHRHPNSGLPVHRLQFSSINLCSYHAYQLVRLRSRFILQSYYNCQGWPAPLSKPSFACHKIILDAGFQHLKPNSVKLNLSPWFQSQSGRGGGDCFHVDLGWKCDLFS